MTSTFFIPRFYFRIEIATGTYLAGCVWNGGWKSGAAWPNSVKEGTPCLHKVGPDKPLGNHPLDRMSEFGVTINDILNWVDHRKLQCLFSPRWTNGRSAVYIWDEIPLHQILVGNQKVLDMAGIPTRPKEYVRYIMRRHVEERSARAVVGRTFADPRFI